MSELMRITAPLDPHCHLRDMDWSHKATFASETAAALAGGYWAVFDMPNTPPSTITPQALGKKLTAISAGARCDWGVYYGASQTNNTATYDQVDHLTCGLKIFCNATTGDLLVENQNDQYQHIKSWNGKRPVAVHAEGTTVDNILQIVRETGKPVHFLHISTKYEIDQLRAAKSQGLPVTVGVCPHHLFLTEADEAHLGAFGLMKPGLKTAKDRDALWQALNDGVVDVIESDHAPHTIAEKHSATPPFGVPGLETTIPLMLTAVHEKRVSLKTVVDCVSTNPRRIWGLEAPPETYCVIELGVRDVVRASSMHSACGWTPFEGMNVTARIAETWIRGKRAYSQGEVLAQPGEGVNLFT
jgi:carbamoyl-phosphate synthase/aspartate carbamoyltransferase/dihydroorotase